MTLTVLHDQHSGKEDNILKLFDQPLEPPSREIKVGQPWAQTPGRRRERDRPLRPKQPIHSDARQIS